MEIKFYNSLSKKIETFIPLKEGEVSMYVCGPTVYNYPHIGNMRPVVVFDTLRRFLEYIGYKVTYVSNFTDVDDKIINEAKLKNISEYELTNFFIDEFKKTTTNIGSKLPTITPRVSEYIEDIISYIDNLVKTGNAYVNDGDVYFRVNNIKDYGVLSGIDIEDLINGARIATSDKKESPIDFTLWKRTSEGIKFSSPWSEGRPGWHTECCVMIDSIFDNKQIDIHGGGYDLKFPHHENEIAQSEATHGNKIARYWLHNNFINVNNEKMSKSLGNVFLAKDLINEFGGETLRLAILSAPYRQPINFTDTTMETARTEITKIKNVYKQLSLYLQVGGITLPINEKGKGLDKFLSSLADDINTPNALACLYEAVKNANIALRNKNTSIEEIKQHYLNISDMVSILGLDVAYRYLSQDDINLYHSYEQAKINKDYQRSDLIRNELIEKGIL